MGRLAGIAGDLVLERRLPVAMDSAAADFDPVVQGR
jgi:hypothetical protein